MRIVDSNLAPGVAACLSNHEAIAAQRIITVEITLIYMNIMSIRDLSDGSIVKGNDLPLL